MKMEKFNKIIFDIFKLTPDKIKDSLMVEEIPNWDSMNYLLLIAELEKQFKVSFNMDEVLKVKSLGDIKNTLRSKGIEL
ncbi:MAG: acyl carrier protein [Patescibacteria group bacterium]